MKPKVAALVSAIEEETRLHEALHDLGLRKRDELVRLDDDAIARTSREEQTVVTALAEAAKRRLKATREVADEAGAPEQDVPLRRLASHLEIDSRRRVFDLACALHRAMKRVARVNRSNRALTEESLRSIRNFFGVLSGAASEKTTYGPRGQQPAKRSGQLMVDHVV